MCLKRITLLILVYGTLFEICTCGPSDHKLKTGKAVIEDTAEVTEWDDGGETSTPLAEPTDESNDSQGNILGVGERATYQQDGVLHNGVVNEEARWHNVAVPYVISPHFDQATITLIYSVMDNFFDNTCVAFRPRNGDYIYIMPGVNCYSNVGKSGGQQKVRLHISCQTFGVIAHEPMHAVGFYHEQARSDRDTYVEINWDNIVKGMDVNFKKYTDVEVTAFGQEYDFYSVLHYGKFEFATKKDEWTIRPKALWEEREIGQRRHLSPIDVRKINQMYQCAESKHRVRGQLYSETGHRGSLTVIHNWTLEAYFKTRQRVYGSAVTLVGCRVTLFTEGAPDGCKFPAPQDRDSDNNPVFLEQHQTRVTKLSCECV